MSAADTYLSAGAIAHAEERRRAAPRPLTWYEGGGTRGDRLSARTRGSPLIPTARGAIIREAAGKGIGAGIPAAGIGREQKRSGRMPRRGREGGYCEGRDARERWVDARDRFTGGYSRPEPSAAPAAGGKA